MSVFFSIFAGSNDTESRIKKQNKYNPKSDFIKILRDLNIQEMRFSKYCMGVLHLNDNVKYNRFKPRLLQINKILSQT